MNAMNILVCEDNVMTLKTIEFALKKAGYVVFKALDGDQGIRLLEEEEIDLVITDINMPEMNGEEMIERIKANPDTEDLAIIVVSTESSETRIELLQKKGAGFVHKPFTPEILREAVLNRIE